MSLRTSSTSSSGVTGHWWAIGLRGVVAVLFGLAALVRPDIALQALILLFGAYALVDGIFALVGAFGGARQGAGRLALIVNGIIGVLVGLLAFLVPGITALALLYLIAAWAIVSGVSEVVLAIELRREISGEWAMVAGGVISVVIGILLALLPWVGVLSLVWLIGIYAIVFGVLLIVLAFRLRSRQTTARPSRVS